MTTNKNTDQRAIIAQTQEHAAFLHADKSVSVFRIAPRDGTLVPLGAGRWVDGIICGSGVNCGVLAHLEPELRRLSGTP